MMKRSLTVKLTPLLALVLNACASSPTSAPAGAGAPGSISGTETGSMIRMGQDSRAVSVPLSATPEQVWAVLPGIYQEIGVQAEMRDDALRTIGSRGFTGGRIAGKRALEFVRCGNSGSGPSSGGMLRTRLIIVTRVMPAGGGKTELVTEVSGTATPVEGTSTGPTACASTGELEGLIKRMAEKAISG